MVKVQKKTDAEIIVAYVGEKYEKSELLNRFIQFPHLPMIQSTDIPMHLAG